MARTKLVALGSSHTGAGVPAVTSDIKCDGGQKEGVIKTSFSSPEAPKCSVLILSDSDDDLGTVPGQTTKRVKPECGKSATDPSMKASRKRVLAVEGPSDTFAYGTTFGEVSPSSPPPMKKCALASLVDGDPAEMVAEQSGTAPISTSKVLKPDNTPAGKTKRRRRKAAKDDPVEQNTDSDRLKPENKENFDASGTGDFHGENGVNKSVDGGSLSGKKRKESSASRNEPPAKRSPSPADLGSEKGTTCHQCRQRIRMSMAMCKNVLGKRVCVHKYCAKCLLNRYGERVAEVADSETWNCPRCRNICNCSICMKKKGFAPTGCLANKAKAAGFSSVDDLLQKHPYAREEKSVHEDDAAPVRSTIETLDDSTNSGVQVVVDDDDDFQVTQVTAKKKKKAKKDMEITEDLQHHGAHVVVGPGPSTVQTANSFCPEVEKFASEECSLRKRKKARRTCATIDVHVEAVHNKDENGSVGVNKDVERALEGTNIDMPRIRKEKKSRKTGKQCRVGNLESTNGEVIDKACNSLENSGEEDIVEEDAVELDVALPAGQEMLNVAECELPADSVGPALQILEFCSAFQKPLKLKRNQPEKMLRELVRGGTFRRAGQSDLVLLHVQLLSMILDDTDEDYQITFSPTSKNCWIHVLRKHLFEGSLSGERSDLDVKGDNQASRKKGRPTLSWPLQSEEVANLEKALKKGIEGYGLLNISTRLQVLASLCDDSLSTTTMRDFTMKAIADHQSDQRENREELLALKKQAKEASESKLAGEITENPNAVKESPSAEIVQQPVKTKRESKRLAVGDPCITEPAPRLNGTSCDPMRTEPVAVHKSGSRFWRLKGADDRSVVVLQGISNLESDVPKEAWSIFSKNDEEPVLQCISTLNSIKKPRQKSRKPRQKKTAPPAADLEVPKMDGALP